MGNIMSHAFLALEHPGDYRFPKIIQRGATEDDQVMVDTRTGNVRVTFTGRQPTWGVKLSEAVCFSKEALATENREIIRAELFRCQDRLMGAIKNYIAPDPVEIGAVGGS